MILDIRTWKPRHLFGAWALYWTGLVATTLGPVLATVQRVASPGGKGSFSVSLGDGGIAIKVLDGAHTVREASATAGVIAAWLAVPPLVLWLAWFLTRPRQQAPGGGEAPLIGEGAPHASATARHRDEARHR